MFRNRYFMNQLHDADTGTEIGGSSDGQGADGAETAEEQQDTPREDVLTKDYIEKMIQSEVDKVRTKYVKEIKQKDKELENYRTATMTAQEKAEYEMQELQKQLEERETTLLHKEMRGTATDLLAASELDLGFADYVIGSDVESTKQRAEAFSKLFSKALEKKIEQRFKEAGRDISFGGGSNGGAFTREQVKNMSQDQINQNWAKIQESMKSWK